MARKSNRLNTKERLLAYALLCGAIAVSGVALLLLNIGLFFDSSKVADNSRMELPMSHTVVNVCEDSLKVWVDKSDFLRYKSGALYPLNSRNEEYKRIVNKNGLAERISEYYDEFEWECDDKKNELSFEMPTFKDSRVVYVSVPTWIIYELVK
jgi:hypothetical protein